jgi:hypothetical protein
MKVWEDIYLTRLKDTGTETLGYLSIATGWKSLSLQTLELPWKDNMPDISCIPPGIYGYEKWYSPTFKTTVIRLLHVPGRTNILIHPANFVRQLRGCIAPGLSMKDIDGDGKIDVVRSRQALYNLMAIAPEKGFIHITKIW